MSYQVGDAVAIETRDNSWGEWYEIDSGHVLQVTDTHIVAKTNRRRTAFWKETELRAGDPLQSTRIRNLEPATPDTEPEAENVLEAELEPVRRPAGRMPNRIRGQLENDRSLEWQDLVVDGKWKA